MDNTKNLIFNIKNKYTIIIIIIIFVLIILNSKVQHFIITSLFTNVAPTKLNDKNNKKMSDEIYQIKKNFENEIKADYSNKCILQSVKTVNYSEIADKLNMNYFKELTYDYTKPILIKNIFNSDILKEFNVNNIVKNYGDVIVEAVNTSDDANINSITVSLKEYVRKIDNGEKYYLTVNNSLAAKLNISKFISFYKKLFDNYGVKNIFLGNKHSSSHLHSEIVSSCALQLSGIKKWYLINPKYSEHLHSIPDKNNIFHVSSKGFAKKNKKTNMIPHYEIIAEEGDFLFVPPWWWHETLNLTNHNLMFSFRPMLFVAPYKTNLSYTLLGLKNSLGYNNLMFPLLTKANIIDPEEDTVVQSIREINARIPDQKSNQ